MADVAAAAAERVVAEFNKNYKKDGLASYVWLLQKYNIKPTLDGPYFRVKGESFRDRQRFGGLQNLRKHTHRHRTRFPSDKPPEEHQPKMKITTKPTGDVFYDAVLNVAQDVIQDVECHVHEHAQHHRRRRHHQRGDSTDDGCHSDTSSGSTSEPGAAPPSTKQPHSAPETPTATQPSDPTSDSSSESVTAEAQQNDSMYLCPCTIGGQRVMLDFDTGSSDLWVMSSHLDKATLGKCEAGNHNIYDPTKSGAKPQPGQYWKISYGDGSSASGDVVKDILVVGGVSVEDQDIECAKSLSPEFMQSAGDGLMGMAFGSINTVKPKKVATPVENMILQKDITRPLFTCWLSSWRDTDEADKGQSFYTFGKYDQAAMDRCKVTDFYWTQLVNTDVRGFWEFASATVTINDKVIPRAVHPQANPAVGNTAIADTGTTLALVDDATCKAIYASIPGSAYDYQNQGYVFPTNTKEADLPNVGFAVGDKTFFCPKEALMFAETKPGTVYGGIQSRGDCPFDILGDTWLKGVYACFDQGNKKFGCVQRTIESQNLSVQH